MQMMYACIYGLVGAQCTYIYIVTLCMYGLLYET
jgi:hypothetical protein